MTQQVYISDTNIWIDLRNAGLLEALFETPQTARTHGLKCGNTK